MKSRIKATQPRGPGRCFSGLRVGYAVVLRVLVVVVALATFSCAPPPPPVAVVGDQTGLAQLAGEWAGEYSSAETGRSGSIVFTLAAGQDTAYGDVVMIPAGSREAFRPPMEPYADDHPRPRAEVLTIRFVRVSGNQISGTLDPYRDPTTGATLATTFEGHLRGDRIEGTYVSRVTGSGESFSGRWRVARKRD